VTLARLTCLSLLIPGWGAVGANRAGTGEKAWVLGFDGLYAFADVAGSSTPDQVDDREDVRWDDDGKMIRVIVGALVFFFSRGGCS